MNRRKTGFLRLFALVITAMTVMTGCKNETSAVMKGLSIENNIAYDYVLSSSLSTAKGFASELGVSAAGSANTEEGVLSASAAILVDITKGEVLYQKNPHLKLYPASTTKVLTGMVALENAELDKLAAIDESIKIDEDNVWICDFRVGDVVTLEQALYGAIVNSGNDAVEYAVSFHSLRV